MAITYNYLNTVLQKGKEEIQNNPFIVLVTLTLVTIPLHHRFSNISLILLVLYSLFQLKNKQFFLQKALILPILLYAVMVLSLFWTISFESSFPALGKGISLVLVPVCFLLNPALLIDEREKILKYYSYSIFAYALFYLIRASIRFCFTQDSDVFFYHKLVSEDVNAIHVAVYVTIAFFWFFLKNGKSNLDKLALITLFILVFLLSSKNIMIIFALLLLGCFFSASKMKLQKSTMYVAILLSVVIGVLFFTKIKERFLIEIDSNKGAHVNTEMSNQQGMVYNVSVKDAWSKERFQHNDYFPGAALRVYQIRIFLEMLTEDKSYLTGYGLNATSKKIEQKTVQYNLYPEYGKFNFHNQFIQIFAEIGFIGFLLLVVLLAVNLKNAIKRKHFVHFSFAILMISLFLTESFLSRHRGIVFFTIMYCVFNSGIIKMNAIKE